MTGKNLRASIRKYYTDPNDPNNYLAKTVPFVPDRNYTADVPYYCISATYRDYNNPSFSLLTFGIDHSYPGYQLIDRSIPHYIFNCIVDGKGTFNGRPFQKGTCFYTKPEDIHTMISDTEDPWLNVWFAMTAPMGKKLADLLDRQAPDQMFPISDAETLLRLMTFFIYEPSYVQTPARFAIGLIELMMSHLQIDSSALSDEMRKLSSHQREIINKSIDYIDAHLSTVTVTSLAKRAHLETKYFSKIFTLVTGISPKQYIISAKMEMATHYLSSTSYSMEEITTLLGYTHRNSLTTTFKRTFHIAPAEYRLKNKDIL